MVASRRVESLRKQLPAILPSLLLCDFGNLAGEVRRLETAGVRALHLDVMDGHFVPNLTYGMPIVEAVRKLTDLPLDVHLMISEPAQYVDAFAKAGADIITFHVEAVADPRPVLRQIRDRGCAAGLAYNPATPLSSIENALADCDVVLTMSVHPGFGGQGFERVALEKLQRLRELAPHALHEVDGGVNETTIGECASAGADLMVVGSGIFRPVGADYGERLQSLSKQMSHSSK